MKNKIELTKDEMIQVIKILEWHTNLVMDIQLQHFDANKKTMRLEQELHHEKWKVRCLTRQAKAIAKKLGDPDIALTEEELDEQIKRSEN
jgi:hypothetical protein